LSTDIGGELTDKESALAHESRLTALVLTRRMLTTGWQTGTVEGDMLPYLLRYADFLGASEGETVDSTPAYNMLLSSLAEILGSCAEQVAKAADADVLEWLDAMEWELHSDWERRHGRD
jgi:hypothetical protein